MNTKAFYQHELAKIQTLADLVKPYGRATIVDNVHVDGLTFPLYSFEFGPDDNSVPLLVIVGGVHGLEFVGAQITVALLESLIQMLHWDVSMSWVLKRLRIVFYPMANPYGLFKGTRANPNGVDLMRNAPVEASMTARVPLVSGHRLSPALPWYRGQKKNGLELEARVLRDLLDEKTKNTPFVFSLDIHSGFGTRDRLWFPYACSKKPFYHMSQVYRFKELFDVTLPNHIYLIEPQSRHYTTHGDLWDYFFNNFHEVNENSIFLPFCLEIGSWAWVRKNPWQIFSLFGLFNPIKPHRLKRALRRHHPFFDFIIRSTLSWEQWAIPSTAHEKAISENEAMKLWFRSEYG